MSYTSRCGESCETLSCWGLLLLREILDHEEEEKKGGGGGFGNSNKTRKRTGKEKTQQNKTQQNERKEKLMCNPIVKT